MWPSPHPGKPTAMEGSGTRASDPPRTPQPPSLSCSTQSRWRTSCGHSPGFFLPPLLAPREGKGETRAPSLRPRTGGLGRTATAATLFPGMRERPEARGTTAGRVTLTQNISDELSLCSEPERGFLMQERVGAARPWEGRGRQGKQSGWPAKEGLTVGWAGAPQGPDSRRTGAAISRWTPDPRPVKADV